MDDVFHGTVSGKVVQLTNDPGLEHGQRVEVVLRPVAAEKQSARSAAGMLADAPNLDRTLGEIQHDRKQAQYRTESQ